MSPWIVRLLCLAALGIWAPLAWAQAPTQTPIYRCVGAHGEPKFSSQPCGTAVQLPGNGAGADAATSSHAFGDVCPASPGALRQAIAGAFESHDVNRLAGVIVWRGIDQASAQAMLRTLADWLKQPLAGIAIAGAAGPPPAASVPSPPLSAGVAMNGSMLALAPTGFEISTAGGGTRDFGITESDGCWWLTFD
ncbi:MAG: hypothetical protein ACREPZ_02435 [Rhodanobacteraceae bacterium]